MRRLGLALFTLVLFTSGARASRWAAPPTERLPGLIRWMGLVAPNADYTGVPAAPAISLGNYSNVSVAVDSGGAVHAVQASPQGIVYMNSWYESRRSNGFSAPLVISVAANGLALPTSPSIAIGPDDVVHVVWLQTNTLDGSTYLYHRKKDLGGWEPIVSLLPPTGGGIWTYLPTPLIKVGADGVLHIVAALAGNSIAHFTDTTSEMVPGAPSGSIPYSLATGPSGKVALSWNNAAIVKTGTTWGSVIPLTGSALVQADLAFDSQSALHMVWSYNNAINYCINGGTTQSIPVNQPMNMSPRVVLDSRDQVHVLYTSTVGLSYAARLRNPDPTTVSTTWATSYAAAIPSTGAVVPVTQALITQTDQIHLSCGQYYTRTLEYGQGARDPAALTPVFPGGMMNVASGNLFAKIDIFTTSGFGPPQSAVLYYNGIGDYSGLVGRGWKLNLETYLVDHWAAIIAPGQSPSGQPNDIVTLFTSDGRPIVFRYNTTYHALIAEDEYGISARLERTAFDTLTPEYRITNRDGTVMSFNSAGKLYMITDTKGLAMSMSFDTNGRLWQLNDNAPPGAYPARWSDYTYEANPSALYPARLIQVKDVAGARVDLGYSGRQLSYVRYLDTPNTPAYSIDYGLANNTTTQDRWGKIKTFRTPNGTVGNYGYSVRYLPDGRLAAVDDPQEAYLLDTEGDTVAPSQHVATTSFAYDESIPLTSPRKLEMYDRRGFQTEFQSEAQRFLVLQVKDQAALNNATGITPVVRTFDTFGNLTDVQDRWGNHTSMTYYPAGTPAYVRDNLNQVYRPKPGGSGQNLTSSYNYTTDGMNNVSSATTYVSPPDETGTTAINALSPTNATSSASLTDNYTYNSKGQVTEIDHPAATQADGTVAPSTNLKVTYGGPQGQPSSITDEGGNVTTLSNYSPTTLMPGLVTPPSGSTSDYECDSYGRVVKKQKAMECPGITLTRDQMARVTKATDPRGRSTTYTYDQENHVTSVTPPAGGPTTYGYDKRGLMTGGTGPDGSWSTVADATGLPVRLVDERGITSGLSYDYAGRVTQSRIPGASTVSGGGGGPALHTTNYAYDQFNGTNHYLTQTRLGSPANRVATQYFDQLGRPVRSLAADGSTAQEYFYDELDRLVASQVKVGSVLQSARMIFRDQRGNVIRTKLQDQPYGITATNSLSAWAFYNAVGSPTKFVDPLGNPSASGNAHTTTYVRDSSQRVTQIIDGKGVVIRSYTYNTVDQITLTQWPAPETKSTTLVPMTQYQYGIFESHLPTMIQDRNNYGYTYTYDPTSDQPTHIVDADGYTTDYTYDPLSRRVTQVTKAQGTSAESRLQNVWTNGLLTQVNRWNPQSGAYDAAHQYSYDQAGRLEKEVSPLLATKQLFYDDFGELSKTIAGTKTITNTYNSLSQRLSSSWSGTWTGSLTYTYTGFGSLQSITDGSKTRSLTYTTWNGLPKDETLSVGASAWKVQTHLYDGLGNATGLVDGEGKTHLWVLDENSRPIQYFYGGVLAASVTYTPGGLTDTLTKYNASGNPASKTVYLYDGLGQLIEAETNSLVNGSVISHTYWTYSVGHRLKTVTYNHLNVVDTLTYDARGQVQSATITGNGSGQTPPPITWNLGSQNTSFTGLEGSATPDTIALSNSVLAVPNRTASYTWDGGGNRLTQTVNGALTSYSYNSANQLTTETWSSKTVSHQYDAWGNENVRTTTGTGAKKETYAYNFQGWLSGYTNSAPAASWQYDFWPDGDRYAKTNLSTNTGELYVASGGDVVNDYTKSSSGTIALENTYVQASDQDLKLTRIPASGGRRHYTGDQVGTLTRTSDDTGTTQDTVVRDIWGELQAGSTTERYGFAQREHDLESGLVYMRARMYDPTSGRFTQADPSGFNGGVNFYAYAGNVPGSLRDPSGLTPDWMYAVQRFLCQDKMAWENGDMAQVLYGALWGGTKAAAKLAFLMARLELGDPTAAWEVGYGIGTFIRDPLGTLSNLVSPFEQAFEQAEQGNWFTAGDMFGETGTNLAIMGEGIANAAPSAARLLQGLGTSAAGALDGMVGMEAAADGVPAAAESTGGVPTPSLNPADLPEIQSAITEALQAGENSTLIDVGGEGRYANAINLNKGSLTTTTGVPGQPIPNLVNGLGQAMPFQSGVAGTIIAENTYLGGNVPAEMARVIQPGGSVILLSPAEYALAAHQAVIDAVGGTSSQQIFPTAGGPMTLTRITAPR